jgi:hypothetical protein
MTFSQFSEFADLLAAFGVIASVLFLAWEMRKSTEQSRLTNWHATHSATREHKRRTDDPYVADVVDRGRANFDALSSSEQVTFGYWMEEWIQAIEGLTVTSSATSKRYDDINRVAIEVMAATFAYPGCRTWWQQSGLSDRWPKKTVRFMETAIVKAEAAEK